MSLLDAIVRFVRGPKCPLDVQETEFIDHWLAWLESEFGAQPLLQEPLTPQSPVLPANWADSFDDCQRLVDTLCGVMTVDPRTIEVFLYDDSDPVRNLVPGSHSQSGAAGLYYSSDSQNDYALGIDAQGLQDPAGLVATVCHELGHVLLLGGERLDPESPEHELVTDLITVYFGSGIFSANAAFRFEQWQDNMYQGWRARRQGYMSEPQWGYALARYTALRGERKPTWWRHLAPSIRYFVEESAYYLESCAKESRTP